jgi:hypothetical protein
MESQQSDAEHALDMLTHGFAEKEGLVRQIGWLAALACTQPEAAAGTDGRVGRWVGGLVNFASAEVLGKII